MPFIQSNEKNKISKNKFILPSINLLKIPTKKEKEKSLNNNIVETDFLEKILLDFGVEGNIKKVSRGR